MPDKYGYTKADVDDPRVKRLMVANLVDMFRVVRQTDHLKGTQFVRKGVDWYPTVGRATEQGVRQHFGRMDYDLAGPGAVAAVSPNMDWERGNIHAFEELANLGSRDWATISKSAEASGGRTSAAKELLADKEIRRAPDANLMKAYRILREKEDPEKVLSRQTAPKTFSFMHNIAGNPVYVTIDGRAHDIAVNQMRPWEADRGISSAGLKTNKTTRYEHFESAHQKAANTINKGKLAVHDLRTGQQIEIQPHHLQAILWEYGKHLEREKAIAGGGTGFKGVVRTGQKYADNRRQAAPPRITPSAEASDPLPDTPLQEQESSQGPAPAVGRSRAERQRGRAPAR